MLVHGAPCIGPYDCPSGTLWNIKPCARPVRMYVILRGACRATLCVVPYRGFPTPLDPNNTGTNSKRNAKKLTTYGSGRRHRSPNNRINVNANIHAPINKQKPTPANSPRINNQRNNRCSKYITATLNAILSNASVLTPTKKENE